MKAIVFAIVMSMLAAIQVVAVEPLYLDADMLEIERPDTLIIKQRDYRPVSAADLRQAVFDRYDMVDSLTLSTALPSDSLFGSPAFDWLDDAVYNQRQIRQMRQRYMMSSPLDVHYNEKLLPEPPRKFYAVVDPMTARLTFVEDDGIIINPALPDSLPAEKVEKRHWIRNFDARLQFAQAYVSPNWYQGGSNNLTMILSVAYDVKLNQNYHPNLLAEMSVSYKLNVHGTPEDSLRNYNISEDLFQFSGKVGIRAAKKWFYSLTTLFKTQFFHSYEVNNPSLKAGFLSPGELNLGVGMTYGHVNARKTLAFDASVSPLSWNMKTCIERDMDVTAFGIRPGRKVVHEFGSSGEAKLNWRISYNIRYQSRVFVFTDYDYIQGDWENTFTFDINRFLSTQLQVHLRYDSSTPRVDDSRWHKWQLNEVLSFGFSYKFSMV